MNVKQFIYFGVFFLLFAIFSDVAEAQNLSDAFLKEHLEKTKYSIDTGASAVVLYEKTSIKITTEDILSSNPVYRQTTKIYRLIKILGHSALSAADVSTGYVFSRTGDIANITATTYNLENGAIRKTPLPATSVYKKDNKNYYEMVFSLSDVREGSIIEYSYDVDVLLTTYPRPWIIQSQFPKLWSEYEIESPDKFEYLDIQQLNKDDVPFKDYSSVDSVKADSIRAYHVFTKKGSKRYSVLWGKRNIPSVVSEPFITDIVNHAERLDLQMSEINNKGFLYNYHREILSTWEKLNEDLLNNVKFGKQIDRSNVFLNKITDSFSATDSALARTKNIFAYVRNHFNCISSGGSIFIRDNLHQVFDLRKGSSAEINLLLVAMLVHAGIHAAPVLLSTVGNLPVNEAYPLLNRFNYLVCVVEIENKKYFLDASNKYNSFGQLPVYCYNGYARIIDAQGQGVDLNRDMMVEVNSISASVSDISEAGYKVNIEEKLGKINTWLVRNSWETDSSRIKSYVDKSTGLLSGSNTVSDFTILNSSDPDSDIVIRYTINSENKNKKNALYMNTDLNRMYTENPFTSAYRKLPIEFVYNHQYSYNMQAVLPEGFTVDELPKTYLKEYGDNSIVFKHIVDYDKTTRSLKVNTSFITTKTDYDAKEYNSMRDFFEKMIREENNIITFKKEPQK